MTSEILSNIVAFVALVFSVAAFVLSYKMTLTQSRATAFSQIMNRLFELNQLEVNNPSMYEKLYNEYAESEVARGGGGLGHYVFMIFNLYEEV